MSIAFISNASLKSAVRGALNLQATSSYLGTVKPDGQTILIDALGTISVVPVTVANTSSTGTVRPDNTSIVVSSGVIAIATSSNGFGVRTISTGSPTGGNDGDIWYQVS